MPMLKQSQTVELERKENGSSKTFLSLNSISPSKVIRLMFYLFIVLTAGIGLYALGR